MLGWLRDLIRREPVAVPAPADPYEDALQAGWISPSVIESPSEPGEHQPEVEIGDARDFLGRVYASQTI